MAVYRTGRSRTDGGLLWLEDLYNGLKTGSGEVAPVLKISHDGKKSEKFSSSPPAFAD